MAKKKRRIVPRPVPEDPDRVTLRTATRHYSRTSPKRSEKEWFPERPALPAIGTTHTTAGS
ncbi:hypothetical protein HaLaN_32856, partial [Haematococcus lacustris]